MGTNCALGPQIILRYDLLQRLAPKSHIPRLNSLRLERILFTKRC